MNAAELCMALLRAENEVQGIQLLVDAGYWDDPDVWRYIGDFDGNWATIGNQQDDAVAALAEKIINGIDARLVHACLLAGIDPKGGLAPKSIRAAVAEFFENAANPDADHVGRIADWEDSTIRDQARLLTLAASGASGAAPCLSVADSGEGQTPDAFPDTFMSLQKRNKADIPFVQGKYNMGGTGALYFCGTNKLQLIVSRRSQRLLGADAAERDFEWGFTVTRRETTGARLPVATYLAPLGADEQRRGSVLSFPAQTFPIFPEASSDRRDAHCREAEYGTVIKLFDYDVTPRSNIVFTRRGIRQKLETRLPELALPVGIFECRRGFGGKEAGSYFTPARGVVTRLEQEKNESLLEFEPLGSILNLQGDELVVRAYAFKREPGQKRQDGFLADYAQGSGVLYTVNGQTHTQRAREFFTRGTVDLDYLKDDLLVVIDCSPVDEIARDDLFMASRDRNRVTPRWRELERMVERFLRSNEKLRELALRRRERAIRDKMEDNKALADVLDRVLQASPDLAKLLLGGIRLPAPFPRPGAGTGRPSARGFKGRRFPTFFHFEKHAAGEELKRKAEIGREMRIFFVTDAQDDYFVRNADRGLMAAFIADGTQSSSLVSGSTLDLSSGRAKWSAPLPADVAIGDVFTYEFAVTDSSQLTPFTNRMVVEVVPRTDRPSRGGRKRKKGGNDGEGEDDGASGLALPIVTPVARDDWADFGFDEHSALAVRRSGTTQDGTSSYDFFYNVDNESLLRSQKQTPQERDVIRERFRVSLVLIGLSLIQESRRRRPSGNGTVPTVEDLVSSTTQALAPVILPMVEMVAALSYDRDD